MLVAVNMLFDAATADENVRHLATFAFASSQTGLAIVGGYQLWRMWRAASWIKSDNDEWSKK